MSAAAGSVGAYEQIDDGKTDDDATHAERRRAHASADRHLDVERDSELAASAADVAGGQDTFGDTSPIYDCHGDISSYAGSYTSDQIGIWFNAVCGSSPFDSANWTVGISHIIWSIDINADGQEDYDIFYHNVAGVEVNVRRSSDFAADVPSGSWLGRQRNLRGGILSQLHRKSSFVSSANVYGLGRGAICNLMRLSLRRGAERLWMGRTDHSARTAAASAAAGRAGLVPA